MNAARGNFSSSKYKCPTCISFMHQWLCEQWLSGASRGAQVGISCIIMDSEEKSGFNETKHGDNNRRKM